MKVEQKEVEFIPVVITLESQLEVDVLRSLGHYCVGGSGIARETISSLSNRLGSYVENDERYFSGEVKGITPL